MTQQRLFESLSRLCRNYETKLESLEKLGAACPPGHLTERIINEQIYYSLNKMADGHHTQIAIPANTRDGVRLIRELREKRVVLHGRRVLRRNIKALRRALSELQIYEPEQYAGRFLDHDGIALPDRDFLPGQLNAGKWIADTKAGNYETNPYYPEDLKHDTRSGCLVRSKSEADWYDMLEETGLLFRYDSAIRLCSGRVIYADFVVLLPKERRLIIIEHFGRMDDPGYAMKNMKRLQDYADSGLVLGRDLFFTLETKGQPLTRAKIRSTLRRIGL